MPAERHPPKGEDYPACVPVVMKGPRYCHKPVTAPWYDPVAWIMAPSDDPVALNEVKGPCYEPVALSDSLKQVEVKLSAHSGTKDQG